MWGLKLIAKGVEIMTQRGGLALYDCATMPEFLVAPGLSAEKARQFTVQ
jgi:hypothetical protein